MEQPIDERPVGLTDEDMERLREALQPILDAAQRFADALIEFAREVARIVRPIVEKFLERWQRAVFAARLRRWHVPDRAAMWIAWRWPKGWLPALARSTL